MIPAPVGHQCPDCVAEARREFRQGPGRQIARANLRSTPVTTVLLVAIGIGYLWELVVAGGPGSLFQGPRAATLIDAGALVPFSEGSFEQPAGGVVGGQWWRLLSSIFLHAGVIHLALNAYVLWIFGLAIEREIGRLAMLGAFLATGIFAGAASFAFSQTFAVAVGASGAIFGLVGAFVAYNYVRRHQMLAQARLRAALSMLLINLVIGFTVPVIDWKAHLGGLVAGVVAGFAVDPGRPAAARRIAAIGGLIVVIAAALVLVAIRSEQIRQDPSAIFR
jgi:membrane associated rhomboid family serine protease